MDLTFESSILDIPSESDRKWIKELVELRHYRTECEELIKANTALVSKLSEMEVKTTELEVKLNAKQIELTQVKALLRRNNSAEPETMTSDLPSPSRKSGTFSYALEDIQLAKEALEREQILRIDTQSQLLACQTKLNQVEHHLKQAANQRDFYLAQIEKLRFTASQAIPRTRKSDILTNSTFMDSSDTTNSISRDIKTHQIYYSTRFAQLNSPFRHKKHQRKASAKFTPSFMRKKKNCSKNETNDTFADSFPEENEHLVVNP